MAWQIEFLNSAEKEFSQLDKTMQKRIRNFLRERVQPDPTHAGESLHGIFKGLIRYRVGNYRLICRVNGNIVTVLKIGHRKEIYKKASYSIHEESEEYTAEASE